MFSSVGNCSVLLDGMCSQVQTEGTEEKLKRKKKQKQKQLTILTAARESIIYHVGPHGEDIE